MKNMQGVQQAPRGVQQVHWVRRFESVVILACSVLFAVFSGCTVGWLYSTLNSVTLYQPVVTVLVAIAFSLFGFILSRSLAYRMQHKLPIRIVLFGVVVYELVETVACFFEALHAIGTMAWLSEFHDITYTCLCVLACVVLSIIPAFTILCGQLDISLDRDKHAGSSVQPPLSQTKPAAPPVNSYAPSAPPKNFQAPPAPPKPAGSFNGVPAVPAQNFQSPTRRDQVPSLPGSDPNKTRVFPESLPAYQPSAQMAPTTDHLDASQPLLGSDDRTLVTEEQSKGGWFSKLPLGRKQKETVEFPPILPELDEVP